MAIKSFHDPCIFQFYWFQNFKWKLRIRTHLLSPSKERNNKKKNIQTLFELVVTLLPTETKNPESLTFCDDMVAAASQRTSNYINANLNERRHNKYTPFLLMLEPAW